MYEITYLDIEENPEYEQIIKDVIKECYKEEHLENSKLTVQITLTNPENLTKKQMYFHFLCLKGTS